MAITSPEAAGTFLEAWRASAQPAVRVASVGAGTAKLLSAGGVEPAFVPSKATAKTLAAADLPTPVRLAKMDDGDEYNRKLRAGAEDMFNYSSYPALLVFKDKPVIN